MTIPNRSHANSPRASVALWRANRRICQFSPNQRAVVELLKFLGFTKIRKLAHRSPDLEPRYREGTRGTFLALR